MSITTRLLSRLSAITIQTGALPLFSWSLSENPPSTQPPTTIPHPFIAVVPATATQDLRALAAAQVSSPGKSVFFFGEHHHQPRILAAQLTLLDELVKLGAVRQRRVVLVIEQFNVLQQGMLDRFCAVDAGAAEADADYEGDAPELLNEAYIDDAGEGFNIARYMPLLLHARSQGVRILGGFPPRVWARVVAREGVDVLRARYAVELERLGFARWGDLDVSAEHAAFAKSLVSWEAPMLENRGSGVQGGGRGMLAAQAFKDAVLAFVIDGVLGGSREDAEEAPLVLVVTGVGHCQYGFGAPERVREVDRAGMCILVAKSTEKSLIWKGPAWGNELEEGDAAGRVIADGVFVYVAK